MGSLKSIRTACRHSGFTLIELLITVAVIAIVLTLAAPSFKEMIELQRLKGVHAQVVTDIQFARSEAVSRQDSVTISFGGDGNTMTCYTVHTCSTNGPAACQCDCMAAEGARCAAPMIEIRTVQAMTDNGVQVLPRPTSPFAAAANQLRFDPATGGMKTYYIGVGSSGSSPLGDLWAETSLIRPSPTPTLRTIVSTPGRPSACSPSGTVKGVPVCP